MTGHVRAQPRRRGKRAAASNLDLANAVDVQCWRREDRVAARDHRLMAVGAFLAVVPVVIARTRRCAVAGRARQVRRRGPRGGARRGATVAMTVKVRAGRGRRRVRRRRVEGSVDDLGLHRAGAEVACGQRIRRLGVTHRAVPRAVHRGRGAVGRVRADVAIGGHGLAEHALWWCAGRRARGAVTERTGRPPATVAALARGTGTAGERGAVTTRHRAGRHALGIDLVAVHLARLVARRVDARDLQRAVDVLSRGRERAAGAAVRVAARAVRVLRVRCGRRVTVTRRALFLRAVDLRPLRARRSSARRERRAVAVRRAGGAVPRRAGRQPRPCQLGRHRRVAVTDRIDDRRDLVTLGARRHLVPGRGGRDVRLVRADPARRGRGRAVRRLRGGSVRRTAVARRAARRHVEVVVDVPRGRAEARRIADDDIVVALPAV